MFKRNLVPNLVSFILLLFDHEKCRYKVIGDGIALLNFILPRINNLFILSEVSDQNGKKYQIVGIELDKVPSRNRPTFISFGKSSKIEIVYVSYFENYCSTFYLPPAIKRVKGSAKRENGIQSLWEEKKSICFCGKQEVHHEPSSS